MNNPTHLPEEAVQRAITHMNDDHHEALVTYARNLAGADWAQSATLTAIDASGFELLVADDNGRRETIRLEFPRTVQDASELRAAFIDLADRADQPDGVERVAMARVETKKPSRYLKALCNHFNRKVTATYSDDHGYVVFPFGECRMQVAGDYLELHVSANSDARLTRTKHVVADHLVRFGNKEELEVHWVEAGA